MAAAMAEGIARENREARISTRATRTSAINEAGIRMIAMEDLGEVARLATSSAAMILEAEHAVLRLQDEQTLRYVIRSYFGPADGRQQERLFRLDKDITVETIRRRTALVLRDLDDDPRIATSGAQVRSLMAAPLKRDGNVIGTFSVYERVASDRFYPVDFNEDDFQIFTRLVSYIERAVENAHNHALARRNRNFDEQTGLPNVNYLVKRIDEEIARSHGRDRALAIATCAIENLDEIRAQGGPARAHRVIGHLAEALRAHLRDFDVLGRTHSARFTILLPDPGHVPDQRIADLAEAVNDAVSQAEPRESAQRVQLAFGHAIYPADGENREELLKRAEEPRIRMG
jgi:diguanylate cyclase (GGDEF)-like protein